MADRICDHAKICLEGWCSARHRHSCHTTEPYKCGVVTVRCVPVKRPRKASKVQKQLRLAATPGTYKNFDSKGTPNA